MTTEKFAVAAARRRDAKTWTADTTTLAALLAAAEDAPETDDKGTHGCLFPGELVASPGTRLDHTIAVRTLLLLDFDDAGDWTPEAFPWCSVAYETHSSSPAARKYRVPVALDRPVPMREWSRVAAAVADRLSLLGIPDPDPSCFKWNQYMFMPERRSGVELATWDNSARPRLVVDQLLREGDALVAAPLDHAGQGLRDAFELPGVVGAFNRAYPDLDDLIETFELPYEPDGTRWRLAGAKSIAGVVEVMPGWWYSHHATDAAAGHVHSAFDLVRIHRFGSLDGEQPAPDWEPSSKSHDAMAELAAVDPRVLAEDFDAATEEGRVARPEVLLHGAASAADWGLLNVGRGRLSDVMRRGADLVSVVCEGEDGYVYPDNDADSNGPVQIIRLTDSGLHARMVYRHRFKVVTSGNVRDYALPKTPATHAIAAATELPHVRELIGVTDFPLVRRDGTLLEKPGYDTASRLYYAPRGAVPEIPERPGEDDVRAARERLEYIVCDFPFRTEDDRANWLGVLITPALRLLVPGPYKGCLIDAPDSGTGKTLLASTLAELYGATKRSSWPASEEEVGKELATIFDTTSAPAVIFDNVSGTLRSRKIEGLLTAAEFAERRLGSSTQVSGRNDRLWVWTANNLGVGGDLSRRMLKVSIDAGQPQPHLRARESFHEPDLEAFVRRNRGDLLGAVLTLVRAWAQAGAVPANLPGSDGFAVWRNTVAGILAHAGVAGQFDSEESRIEAQSEDDGEWATFLAAIRDQFGDEPWYSREIANSGLIDEDDWPDELLNVRRDVGRSLNKSLGRWLRHRERRWAGGLSVVRVASTPEYERRNGVRWKVVTQ